MVNLQSYNNTYVAYCWIPCFFKSTLWHQSPHICAVCITWCSHLWVICLGWINGSAGVKPRFRYFFLWNRKNRMLRLRTDIFIVGRANFSVICVHGVHLCEYTSRDCMIYGRGPFGSSVFSLHAYRWSREVFCMWVGGCIHAVLGE